MVKGRMFRVALASIRHPDSIEQGVDKVITYLKRAASRKAEIVCFPEAYLPGLRGLDLELPPPNQQAQESALESIRLAARRYRIAVIIPMEWSEQGKLYNRAYVISAAGRILGYQTKNQITPFGEDRYYVPDGTRRVFSVNGVKFGIVLCHEGWRYPETVRWAAVRGARIVFQPQVTGSDKKIFPPPGISLNRWKKCMRNWQWGKSFYEQAMICRTQENSIYFASVNTAMRYQNSATSIVDPSGKCIAYVPYGVEKLLVADLDISKATRFYAKRFTPTLYPP